MDPYNSLLEFGKVTLLDHLNISVCREELVRFFSRGADISGESAERFSKQVENLQDFYCDLMCPRGLFVFVKTADTEFRILPWLDKFPVIAVCLVTIGKELEGKVSFLSQTGEVNKSALLDGYGSVGCELLAAAVEKLVKAKAKESNLYGRCRCSPGFPALDLKYQAEIFKILPADRLGVFLNDSLFMVPRKSISFIIGFTGQENLCTTSPLNCKVCGSKMG